MPRATSTEPEQQRGRGSWLVSNSRLPEGSNFLFKKVMKFPGGDMRKFLKESLAALERTRGKQDNLPRFIYILDAICEVTELLKESSRRHLPWRYREVAFPRMAVKHVITKVVSEMMSLKRTLQRKYPKVMVVFCTTMPMKLSVYNKHLLRTGATEELFEEAYYKYQQSRIEETCLRVSTKTERLAYTRVAYHYKEEPQRGCI